MEVLFALGVAALLGAAVYAAHLATDLRRSSRSMAASWAAIDTMRRPHRWEGWTLLDEPGISDFDGGRWQRAHVRCAACGEERTVWKSIPRDTVGFALGCPGTVA